MKTGYHENLDDIDQEHFFEVMLAKNLNDYKEKINWERGVIVQIKFNGHRCVARSTGLFTRTGEKYISVPHIEEDLEKFFKDYPQAILDGELFNFAYRNLMSCPVW